MEPLQTISVGDRITVYREDRGGSRIPNSNRRYVAQNEYFFHAEVVQLCPGKRYNYVHVIETTGTLLKKKRKAYKSKCFQLHE
jgi:hypothetical protein